VRKAIFIITAILLLLLGTSALADEARDYIYGEVAEWTTIAQNNNYNILGTYISTIGSTDVIYSFDLAPGTYHFYMSGGKYVEDLDAYLYDSEGIEIDSDALPDKIPVLVFSLSERTVVDLTTSSWAFVTGYESGYFCLLATCEDEGQIFEFTGTTVEMTEGPMDVPEIEDHSDMDEDDDDEMEDEDEYGDEDEYDDDDSGYVVGEADYVGSVESSINYWEEYEIEMGHEIVESGMVLVEGDDYTESIDLDVGFYSAYASPDLRCIDLDMTVYNEDGDEMAEDHLADNYPICNFYMDREQEIDIDFEVFEYAEDFDETYVGYIISSLGGTDDDERMEYVEEQLDWLMSVSEDAGETVIDSGTGELTGRSMSQTHEVFLEAGDYLIEGEGGLEVRNLNISLYYEDGSFLNEDIYEDAYPMVWFDIAEAQTISFEVTAIDVMEPFDNAFYCWIVSQLPETYDDEYGWDNEWSGDENELILKVEEMAEMWMRVIEAHGEEIVEYYTEQVMPELDQTREIEMELDKGVYYFYAVGDGICLTDLDMIIYAGTGDDMTDMDADYLWSNAPVCSVEVGTGGETITVVCEAYGLNCEMGYFHLIVAKD